MIRIEGARWRSIIGILLLCPVAMPHRLAAQQNPYQRFIAPTDPLPPSQQQQKFHLPPGFAIELVAAEPEIRKPVNLSFDASGRLYVTESVEYPLGAPADSIPRDAIKVLDDTGGDGQYDHIETFADALNIPVGITPLYRGAVAFSIPRISLFLDQDDDLRADHRRTLYCGFDTADTHGLPNSFTWWIDGWIYACHGEGNVSQVRGLSGQPVRLDGGSTFRLLPNGSRVEAFTHGQANPFGLCFDPLGDIYTADSHSKPATLLLRGGWYPGVQRRHDGLGLAPALMLHFHNSTGIGGIAYYADEVYPPEYRGSLLIGNPATGRINCDRLIAHGSTYEAVEQPDFVTCDDPWFRPVHLQMGPDGALYIADFYNRIIAHTNVPLRHGQRDRQRGRIWRVVYRPVARQQQPSGRSWPDLATADAGQLIEALGHPNLLVRTWATHELVERIGAPIVEPLRDVVLASEDPRQTAHGLWVLTRLKAMDVQLAERLAVDPERTVRVHLMRALGERTEELNARWRQLLLAGLSDPDALVRRAAADALGRHPHETNIQPLLALWESTPDEDAFLIHTVRLALRDSLRPIEDLGQLARRLSPDRQRRLADVCLGLPTRPAARFVFAYLQRARTEPPNAIELLRHAALELDQEQLPQLFAFATRYQHQDPFRQRAVLKVLFDAAWQRRVSLPSEIHQWASQTASRLLFSNDELEVTVGVEIVWDLRLKPLAGELARWASPSAPFPSVRSTAMDALVDVDPVRAEPFLLGILANLQEPLDVRDKAADALGRLNQPTIRDVLTQHLATAPARLATTIARRLAATPDGAKLLLDAAQQGKASPQLLADATVDQQLRRHSSPAIEQRLLSLVADLPDQNVQLVQAIEQLGYAFSSHVADPQRGWAMFEKHCAACHVLGGRGTRIGPALDGIAARGLDRLLEDILWPHRNVDVQYRSTTLQLTDGRVFTGLVTDESNGLLVVANEQGKLIHVRADEVIERRPLQLSPMPANFREILSEAELFDLVARLLRSIEPLGGPAQEKAELP